MFLNHFKFSVNGNAYYNKKFWRKKLIICQHVETILRQQKDVPCTVGMMELKDLSSLSTALFNSSLCQQAQSTCS